MIRSPAVVVVSARLGPVLPAAALPLLSTGAVVRADADLPPALRYAFAAEPAADEPAEPEGLLLTVDAGTGTAAVWLAGGADLLPTPEPAGAVLLDAVAVMDRLRSPGGCPWDAEQTHASLLPYLIEETYELYQALEEGDLVAMREELGDVLLQVLFHARVAAEDKDITDAFDVDAVAAELVVKLVARHPHVFGDAEHVATAAAQELRWEELKRTEKRRESSVDGVALAQPAAALSAKLVARTTKAGLPAELLPGAGSPGAALFAVVAAVKNAGEDPEAALRTAARRFAVDVRSAEHSARDAGLDPVALTPEQWHAHWPSTP